MKDILTIMGAYILTALVLTIEMVFWLAKIFVAGLIILWLALLLCLGIFHVMSAIDPLPEGKAKSTCIERQP
jgi:hypothetical protein